MLRPNATFEAPRTHNRGFSMMTTLRGIIARLRERPDTEHVMCANRFAFCCLTSAFFIGTGAGPAWFGPVLFSVAMSLTCGIFAHLLAHPEPHTGRRLALHGFCLHVTFFPLPTRNIRYVGAVMR